MCTGGLTRRRRGVGERVLEGVERGRGIDAELEVLAGAGVGDANADVVRRGVPDERDVQAVAGAVREFLVRV